MTSAHEASTMGRMPHPQVSRMVEDYLTLIWKAYEWPDSSPSTTDLATSLGVTAPTVSANLKKLARDGLIAYEPYGAIELTPTGRSIAVEIVRRHRIIETYLVQALGLSWDQVHVEADRLEHAVSDLVLDRMDAVVGHPRSDPHGDPIPDKDGRVARTESKLLSRCEPGEQVRVIRVSDRHPDVLRFLVSKAIEVGSEIEVVAVTAGAGVLQIRVAGSVVDLPLAAADQIRVAEG